MCGRSAAHWNRAPPNWLLDIAFHQGIARASGNALFLQIVRSFEALMRVAVPSAWHRCETPAQRDEMMILHRHVAQAIADCDPSSASHLMTRHFDTSITDLFARAARKQAKNRALFR